MRFRTLASMISTENSYSLLRWPFIINCVLITVLALTLLLSFSSNAWFTYESFDGIEKSISSNLTMKYLRSLEYGSFGLWKACIGHDLNITTSCDTWTRRTRPEVFNVIIVLASCALFLVNLTIFPAWATIILILYNIHNRYIRQIVTFQWILFCLSLLFTVLLISVLMLLGISKYYSPGTFLIEKKHIAYHIGSGIFLILMGTILAGFCLFLIIISLIWKKYIDMRLVEQERQLYRQLTEENSSSIPYRVIQIPRSTTTGDDDFEQS